MAGKDYNINIKINGADDASKDLGKVSESVKKVATESTNSSKSMSSLASAFSLSTAVMAGAAAVVALSIAVIGKSITEAADKQTVLTKLSNVLKITGSYSEEAVKQFEKFADTMQKTQNIDGDVVLGLISLGKQLGLTNEQAKQMTTAAMKLSAATGQDVQTAFIQLNGTLEGSVGKLAKLGNGLGNLTQEQLKSGKAIDIINKNFADNSALVNTANGQFEAAKLAAKDFFEELGNFIIKHPSFMSAMKQTVEVVDYLTSKMRGDKKLGLEEKLEQLNAELKITEDQAKNGRSAIEAMFGLGKNEEQAKASLQSIRNEIKKTQKELQDMNDSEYYSSQAGKGSKNPDKFNNKPKTTPEEIKTKKEIDNLTENNSELINEQARYYAELSKLRTQAQDEDFTSKNDIKALEIEAEARHQEELLNIKLDADLKAAELIENKAEREKAKIDASQKWFIDSEKVKNKGQIDAAKSREEFDKKINEDRKQNMKSTLSTISTLMSSSNEELFNIGKAAAIAQATMDGIAAVQVALKSAPPPFNFALAGIVGVATAANVVKIGETKMQRKEFGGYVDGGGITGDSAMIRANKGELLLTKYQQANLLQIATSGSGVGNAELLVDLINVLEAKDFTVNIDGEKMNKKLTEVSNRRLT